MRFVHGKIGRRVAGVAVLLVGMLVGGCNVIGAAAYVAGPPSVKPQYEPPKRPMLVLVDTSTNANPLDAEQLERHVILELQKRDIAPIADAESIYTMRLEDPTRFGGMAITSLGRMVGASQVLYITASMGTGELAPWASVLKGYGTATVRVVDVTTGQTAWPPGSLDGHPVGYEARPNRTVGATAAKLRSEVQSGLADRIVKLFYKHKPEWEDM
jgi:hypothetical protein